jgi:putative ATP-dependent endonuclease of OLD family
MFIESITLSNFRCFGLQPVTVPLEQGLTTFIGSNGSGKTALMQALLRLFGTSNEQRRIRKQDFHVPLNEASKPNERELYIEVKLAFPELHATEEGKNSLAVPEFFKQMTIEESGEMKCRIRLEAKWIDDGTAEGAIEQLYFDTHHNKLQQGDRGRIQVIYIPAFRDGASHVTNALKSRLWKAIAWSEALKSQHKEIGGTLETTFQNEMAIKHIAEKVNSRWQEVHNAGTDTEVFFSPVDSEFESFIKKVNVGFRPDENGDSRDFEALSDGQRSLFHIALTSALLDVENEALISGKKGFLPDNLHIPVLTLLAVEEPENNLAPFYLSRIIRQIESIVGNTRAQAVLSTHSASTLTRIKPESIRYFRCDTPNRTVSIRPLTLPENNTDIGKYVREAVRAYPELYFAKFVILGEGDSELIVLPRLAEALELTLDPSFVAIVPLGGRHVNHFWKLLNDLEIPHATLLDLDLGRQGGGWGRIKYACEQLRQNGRLDENNYQTFPETGGNITEGNFQKWLMFLREEKVFFSSPLDIDMLMLRSFSNYYKKLEGNQKGPQGKPANAKKAALKEKGDPKLYTRAYADDFCWYQYLFLSRGKPESHLAALSRLNDTQLANSIPEPLNALLQLVERSIKPEVICDDNSV